MIPLTYASALFGPLALSILFGLTFAMLLTLILVPILVRRWPGTRIREEFSVDSPASINFKSGAENAQTVGDMIYNIFSGRLNRAHFIVSQLIGVLLSGVVGIATMQIAAVLATPLVWIPSALLIGGALFGPQIRRLHDMGYDGFVSLSLLVPGINVIYLIWISLFTGESSTNQYGPVDSAGATMSKAFGLRKTYGNLPY